MARGVRRRGNGADLCDKTHEGVAWVALGLTLWGDAVLVAPAPRFTSDLLLHCFLQFHKCLEICAAGLILSCLPAGNSRILRADQSC